MQKYIHRGDIAFALLLAFFLCWGAALMMEPISLLNMVRLAWRFLLVAVLLEVVLALVAYLRGGKGLFGQKASMFFFWQKAIGAGIVLSALFAAFYAIYLPWAYVCAHWLRLVVLGVLGVAAVMLYLRSLVRKQND